MPFVFPIKRKKQLFVKGFDKNTVQAKAQKALYHLRHVEGGIAL